MYSMYFVSCTVHFNVHCVLYTVQYTVSCTLCPIHCILYTVPRGENTGGVGVSHPPTEKIRQFAGQLNPFAGHKFSLTVAHSASRCCHGACEAPGKIVKIERW